MRNTVCARDIVLRVRKRQLGQQASVHVFMRLDVRAQTPKLVTVRGVRRLLRVSVIVQVHQVHDIVKVTALQSDAQQARERSLVNKVLCEAWHELRAKQGGVQAALVDDVKSLHAKTGGWQRTAHTQRTQRGLSCLG
jgi:hypothetical protein